MTAPTGRNFIGVLGIVLLAGLLLCCSAQQPVGTPPAADRSRERLQYTNGFGSMPCSKCIAPAEMASSITLDPEGEPGEKMLISGTIFRRDGRTPASGIVLYVYQTDATGYYSKDDDPYNPRLRGWMRTGTDGRYEFRTIKPAPYPKRSTPAHIHAQIYSDQMPEHSIDEYLFEGDPLLTDKERKQLTGRGGPGAVVKLTRDSKGVLVGHRDITLDQ